MAVCRARDGGAGDEAGRMAWGALRRAFALQMAFGAQKESAGKMMRRGSMMRGRNRLRERFGRKDREEGV